MSTDPNDHAAAYDFARDVAEQARTDARYAEASKGVMDFSKIAYRTGVGDLSRSSMRCGRGRGTSRKRRSTSIPRPGGRAADTTFSRRVDPNTLERVDSAEQIDSWNRTWVFFEWWLRPYLDKSRPATN